MILYVNGDSHSLGHGTGNTAGMTTNDPKFSHIDEAPHPDNLPHSYGAVLARDMGMNLVCQARSGGSIARAIRTTKQFVYQTQGKVFVLIGVPSFEREEWIDNHGVWWPINSSGYEKLPAVMQARYRQWVIDWGVGSMKYYHIQEQHHATLIKFHEWLTQHNVKHLFFNTAQTFEPFGRFEEYDWGLSYYRPYGHHTSDGQFCRWCLDQGFPHDTWGHFGKDAHVAWAQVLKPLIENNLVS
jgi:hypothetical protein